VLVNPGVAVPTAGVFKALAAPPLTGPVSPDDTLAGIRDVASLVLALGARRNDLEIPAVGIQPVIADVIAALRAAGECSLARMSGSGATCFGLFATTAAAQRAARSLRAAHSGWWVQETVFG
jgi:4-diphosphocytidyl-2-C-methyl-D-erythritol kinase